MLAKAGAIVDSVESNRTSYVKCLIAKEILQLSNVRFLLGDCVQWVERCNRRYDLVVACGILYHMEDPLRLLRAIANITNNFYLWTVYVDQPEWSETKVEQFEGRHIRLYEVPYASKGADFLGSASSSAYWMRQADILAALKTLGFDSIEISDDQPSAVGRHATFSVYAHRTT